MMCRLAVLVLVAGGCSWGAYECYEIDGSTWVTPGSSATYTCDSDYRPCNPYLHNEVWVSIECAGHPQEGYPGSLWCVADELSLCFYADELEEGDPQTVSADAELWEDWVDPDDPGEHGLYVGQHTKHQSAITAQIHYRVMPMFMGQGYCVMDTCQSFEGLRRWYSWFGPPDHLACP
ncbi:MAG TPA: hypothetical protein PLD23_22185 [Armatimonadota bacterium]|nr:hypothetical protein [Armatimonadota bacterium]